MVRYLKDRGVYVLFNTNGTLLNKTNGRAMVDAGLDELRVSLDASNRKSYIAIRGKDYFERILRNVRAFRAMQEREGHRTPRVSAWLTGLKETLPELPEFVRVAAVHRRARSLSAAAGLLRRRRSATRGRIRRSTSACRAKRRAYLEEAEAVAKSLGVTFSASGAASEPGMSLKRQDDANQWSLCRRPWTVMYFTANGRALPCCIAPFSQRGYEHYTLGDATQQSLQEIWNGAAYQDFRSALLSDRPPNACASCGVRWSL